MKCTVPVPDHAGCLQMRSPCKGVAHLVCECPGAVALRQGVEALRAEVLEQLRERGAAAVRGRRPLVRKGAGVPRLPTFTPQFEEEYAPGKDFDPDRRAPVPGPFSSQLFPCLFPIFTLRPVPFQGPLSCLENSISVASRFARGDHRALEGCKFELC